MMSRVREEWLRVIAHAWKNREFSDRLRADPRATLDDDDVRTELNLTSLSGGSNGGYLPLPEIPDEFRDDTEQQIFNKLINNRTKLEELFGRMQFCIP